ncbi:MAG: hypothetical protein JO327_01880 [Nitrososphaeraceae archaeon]|nr:hypothetical protein [Nitrososphaeraceae archaeon]MBV9666859.1 hypothetical protein [Nitrososphaeraceae archaeon]
MVIPRRKVIIHNDAINLLGSAFCYKGVASNEMLKEIKLESIGDRVFG